MPDSPPDGTRVEATVAGGATFFRDLQSATENDLRRAELVTLPVAAIVLTLVFAPRRGGGAGGGGRRRSSWAWRASTPSPTPSA